MRLSIRGTSNKKEFCKVIMNNIFEEYVMTWQNIHEINRKSNVKQKNQGIC